MRARTRRTLRAETVATQTAEDFLDDISLVVDGPCNQGSHYWQVCVCVCVIVYNH